jgi:hypothetical protein
MDLPPGKEILKLTSYFLLRLRQLPRALVSQAACGGRLQGRTTSAMGLAVRPVCRPGIQLGTSAGERQGTAKNNGHFARKRRIFRVEIPQIFRVDRHLSNGHYYFRGRGRLTATKAVNGTMSEQNAGQLAGWSGIEKEPNDRGFGL